MLRWYQKQYFDHKLGRVIAIVFSEIEQLQARVAALESSLAEAQTEIQKGNERQNMLE